ncbi:hypothetical protein [Haloarchaeobius litoreus]|uniref:Uncharacterized protein n=1 Tax=Haloarchaeobius litoreus TaxID=755306 RepID=A0ABD6DPE4_9EURY|nr:hypothetical protein [Haloarchaeobius litoreus]
MSWGELFDRAAEYDVTVEDVRETLTEHRRERGDENADDGGDDER